MPDDQLTFDELRSACSGNAAAIRTRIHLQPVAGPGEKVFPATHLKGVYAEETRCIPDGSGGIRKSKVVLIDSVQSEANRLEHTLLEAVDNGEVALPILSVSIDGHRVTSLDAPHRVYDAFFWDSLLDGTNFRQSEVGKVIVSARPRSAQALFIYAPTSLLFGAWDSRAGGLQGARFPRAVVSEIVALDAEVGVRTSSRICPIGIKKVTAYKGEAEPYTLHEDEAAKDAKGKAIAVTITALGHSNIPPRVEAGGITAAEIVQTAVISLTQLRQLRFGDENTSNAARAALAAIALFALARQVATGYSLRSRCHLVPVEEPVFELIGNRAGDVRTVRIDAAHALQLVRQSVEAARNAGLAWHSDPIQLDASPRLIDLVRMSEQALVPQAEEEENHAD
jgi:CRISPR-associated protein Csb1